MGKVEEVFEGGVPFRDVTNISHQLNEQNNNYLHHQLQLRAANIDRNNIIGSQVVEHGPNNALSSHKFDQDEETIREFLRNCSRNLESIIFPSPLVTSDSMWTAPTWHYSDTDSLRSQSIVAQKVNNNKIVPAKKKNSLHLNKFVTNLYRVEQLALVGRKIATYGYVDLAKLPNLIRLDIHIRSTTFSEYPNSLDADQDQKLDELHISMENINVTKKFAECFERFIHLTKLTVYIGSGVKNSQDLLLYFGRLSENSKLESLTLAGNIDGFGLEVNYFEIAGIKEVRVCTNQHCKCTDHAKMCPD